MCVMCDGATREEVRQRLYQQICDRGYALVPVGRGWDDIGWAYTLGLVDGYLHPELVVAGVRLGLAVTVVDELARSVVQGARFDVGGLTLPMGQIEFVDVHDIHLDRGLMDGWLDYYHAAGRREMYFKVLQVVLLDGTHCHENQTTQPRLDTQRHVSFDGIHHAPRRTALRRSGK